MGFDSNPGLKGNTATDVSALVAKGILGAIPVAGSLLAELVGAIIPRQRTDRIAAYLMVLEARLNGLDQQMLRSKFLDPWATNMIEESFLQAMRAISDERRQQIAEVVAKGLSQDAEAILSAKRILFLLSELDDIDILFLKAYQIGWTHEFTQKHWKSSNQCPRTLDLR